MKLGYAFPGALVVCALLLSSFHDASPAAAQDITICSKRNEDFRQTGTLKRLDERNYVLLTGNGEQSFSRGDFASCPTAAPTPAPAPATSQTDAQKCPDGQASSPNGCVCPANLTMSSRGCVEPPPVVEVAPGKLAECKSRQTLTIQGSSTIGLGIMPALIAGFANAKSFNVATSAEGAERQRAVFQLQPADPGAPCFVITVLSTGSDTAKEGIVDGKAQIGMSSRYYTDGEIEALARAGKLYPDYERNQIEHIIGLDAVGVVVNKANPVASLELCQIAKVFSGKIRDWRELNGLPRPINVHVRTTTSGTFETFKELVMDTCREMLVENVPSHGTYPDLLDAVATDEASIGFAPGELVDSRHAVKALSLRSGCGIEQAFNAFNVKSEDYPLARRLYIFTPIALTGYASDFENFILTDPRVDDLVRLSGAIDQKVDRQRDDHTGSVHTRETEADPASRDRFNGIVRYGQRLSITYRFASGSEKLDTKARQDIVRLRDDLRNIKPRPTVYLAGFTDDIGSVGANRELATKRANGVRNELLTIVPDMASNMQAEGFGKILPVNCNDTQLGKSKNRRVEVFVTR
jgi:phosphate transport system substrate-binding protein